MSAAIVWWTCLSGLRHLVVYICLMSASSCGEHLMFASILWWIRFMYASVLWWTSVKCLRLPFVEHLFDVYGCLVVNILFDVGVDLVVNICLGNRVATFLRQSCQLCLQSVHFLAAKSYLPVFPFCVGGLMWIWLYQFLSSLHNFVVNICLMSASIFWLT